MLLFAHTGIALGAGAAAAGLANLNTRVNWFSALSKYLDIRIFIIGSMLPDLIDKPVGQYLFRDTFQNGRIFSHTLVFLALLTVIGFILHKVKGRTWMLALTAGTFLHLALDQMWLVPGTLLWPFMGWSFNAVELEGWTQGIANALISDPLTYITESLGLAVLIWFGLVVLLKKKAGAFIRTGRIK
jgi:inner membrane protein